MIQEIESDEERVRLVGVDTYLFILFNALELHFKNIDRIKAALISLEQDEQLTSDQFALYSALVTLSRGDVDNYSFYMDQLATGSLS